MKKTLSLLSLAACALAWSSGARADLALNASIVSDYRYRGISQTRLQPAAQAGVDFSQGGLYLGAWSSSIRWVKDAGGGAPLELDLYGGHKGELAPGLGYDIGLLRYQYPGARLPVSPNTTEVYAGLGWSVFSAKYSHSTTHLFGFDHSRGSGYWDLSATLDLGHGLTLTPHIGHQRVRGNAAASYTDYAITLGKTIDQAVLSLTWLGTDNRHAYLSPRGKNLGGSRLVLGAKINF